MVVKKRLAKNYWKKKIEKINHIFVITSRDQDHANPLTLVWEVFKWKAIDWSAKT